MADGTPCVVIDNGSGTVKVGFGGEEEPRVCVSPGAAIQFGTVFRWDDMEELWRETMVDKLGADPTECTVLLTEGPFAPEENRKKKTEMMFETFGISALHLPVGPALSLYPCGKTSGVVLDCGDMVTLSVPVYEGEVLTHAALRHDIGGRILTEYLSQLLRERQGVSLTASDVESVREMKEKYGQVIADPLAVDETLARTTDRDVFVLPDGKEVPIESERFQAPEALFRPEFIGSDACGIDTMVFRSAIKCDVDLRHTLLHNIVLSGGTSLFPGFRDRIHNALYELTATPGDHTIFAPAERGIGVWLGGSILSSLSTFPDMCIQKEEYDEVGPGVCTPK